VGYRSRAGREGARRVTLKADAALSERETITVFK
jgi:hypothetical protein